MSYDHHSRASRQANEQRHGEISDLTLNNHAATSMGMINIRGQWSITNIANVIGIIIITWNTDKMNGVWIVVLTVTLRTNVEMKLKFNITDANSKATNCAGNHMIRENMP